MREPWINISALPKQGEEFSFSDQEIWLTPARELGVPIETVEPFVATVFILPQEQGCLIKGRIVAKVQVPCDRCLSPVVCNREQTFEQFEDTGSSSRFERDLWRKTRHGDMEFNLGAVLWEQFMLASPVQTLCSDNCKGFCVLCGGNLNKEKCDCKARIADTRLAPLQGLIIPARQKK